MASSSLVLCGMVICFVAINVNGQNYIRLSRSDPSLNLVRKTYIDHENEHAQPGIVRARSKTNPPLKNILRQELLESIAPPRKRYGGYIYDGIMDLPSANKRTNYVRLAKKRSELGKISDIYDDVQYDEK